MRHLLSLPFAMILAGCASLPVLEKHAFDFKSTELFRLPCPPGRDDAGGRRERLEVALNECNGTRLVRMVESFMSIQEADPERGLPGDTMAEVRAKGFSIFVDPAEKKRRPNTRPLYGNEALAAVGMGVSPPPLQRPEEIRAYTEFMARHYGEEYYERDVAQVTDRFCLNVRDSLELGDDRVFAIVWRSGRVFKRVIKGGPVNNPKQERGLLLCPGSFIVDTVTGTAGSAARALVP